jgi:hypothetical protein
VIDLGLWGALRYRKDEDIELGAISYWAHIGLKGDLRERAAMHAANVNRIRRYAPFAYFFANGFTVDSWRREDIGDNDYRNSLDSLQLSRGFWPGAPDVDDPTTTVVTAILDGDVTPFVRALQEIDFAFYCSPSYRSLVSIDHLTARAANSREATKALLRDGACVITASEEVAFRVLSADDRYDEFFMS